MIEKYVKIALKCYNLMNLLAKRSGSPKRPGGGRGSPGFPQIGDRSRFSGVRFSGSSPNPNSWPF